MSSQRYAPISAHDNDDADGVEFRHSAAVPNSPPPSFHSDDSRRPSRDHTAHNAEEQDLDDAFDAPSDDDDDDDDDDTADRRRLINATSFPAAVTPEEEPTQSSSASRSELRLSPVTVDSSSAANPVSGRRIGGGANDGVFANLSAKPRPGDDLEEKPPTYEQAAADATPPYWETTVLSPYATTGNPDDVFVDGLLVGSFFSFVWNALISMSFQLIGFLLTYLLHTTHAAKHGSRTGLGITLVQYGFQMRYASTLSGGPAAPSPGDMSGINVDGVPNDPNAHDFDSSLITGGDSAASAASGLSTTVIFSYVLMVVGWFILIRAVSDFMRARRQEALVRSSPDRGLGVAVVAENEHPESSV